MKILLINPIFTKRLFTRLLSNAEPLGLCYIAAMLTDKHEVEILDGAPKGLTYDEVSDNIRNFKPDIIGISLPYSLLIKQVKELALYVKNNFPDVKIVLGGNAATFTAENLISDDFIDVIVMGEGEFTFKELVDVFAKKDENLLERVNGICFKTKNNEIKFTPPREIEEDLDIIPFPARNLLKDKTLYERTIVPARGCPYGCIYCSTSKFFKKHRRRSIPNIMKEIESLYDNDLKYGTENVIFVDDIMTSDHERLNELCDALEKSNNKIVWGCYGRIENINKDILIRMREVGCNSIFFGIESGSPKILNLLKRKYTPDDVLKVTNWCKEIGIRTQSAFIIGLPYETKEDLALTFKLIEKIPDSYVFSIFTALPGTPVYNKPAMYGLKILPHPPEDDNFNQASWIDNGCLTPEEVMQAYYRAVGLGLQKGKKHSNYENIIN